MKSFILNKLKLRQIVSLVMVFSLMFMISCIPNKKLIYLQDKVNKESSNANFNLPAYNYKIKAGDELYIKIVGLDDKTATLFTEKSNQNTNLANSSSGGIFYYTSLTVTSEGAILFPTLGMISVSGNTIDEVQQLLQDSLQNYVNYGAISVKLANFKVNVLGEVNSPGSFYVFDDKANIFDALGMAGDLTAYGNRAKIAIVRETGNGLIYQQIDITDRNFLNSPYYYIYPGDAIYVPQLRAKAFGLASFPWTTILSIISTSLSAFSIIVYLNK